MLDRGAPRPEARLQLALDVASLPGSAALASVLRSRVARVEVGTPLLLHSGMSAVEIVRSVLPEGVTVVADTKICDAGKRIAADAFAAGANVVTVAGVAVDELHVAWGPRSRRRRCGSAGHSYGRHRRVGGAGGRPGPEGAGADGRRSGRAGRDMRPPA